MPGTAGVCFSDGLPSYKEHIAKSAQYGKAGIGVSYGTEGFHSVYGNGKVGHGKGSELGGCAGADAGCGVGVVEGEGGSEGFTVYGAGSTDDSREARGQGAVGCGTWAVLAECESGQHRFAKRLVCGREWCEVCGADGSAAHKRRQARVYPKVMQLGSMGYLVIEFPRFYRQLGQGGIKPDIDCGRPVEGWCYSKEALRYTTNKIVEVLAGKRGSKGRYGGYFSRGLARWHWFGEKRPGYNPHLNVLVDGGYLRPELLQEIKATLREALNVPDLIVNYSYTEEPRKMVHRMRYITRSTFRVRAWNDYMANELYNFRNMRWWGSWKDELAWSFDEGGESEESEGLQAVSQLQSGMCPDCGRPLKVLRCRGPGRECRWSGAVDAVWLKVWSAREINGTGYYRVPVCEDTEVLNERDSDRRARPKSCWRVSPLPDSELWPSGGR
jgi:hypothetical protein